MSPNNEEFSLSPFLILTAYYCEYIKIETNAKTWAQIVESFYPIYRLLGIEDDNSTSHHSTPP
jgi:hypothetical protein